MDAGVYYFLMLRGVVGVPACLVATKAGGCSVAVRVKPNAKHTRIISK